MYWESINCPFNLNHTLPDPSVKEVEDETYEITVPTGRLGWVIAFIWVYKFETVDKRLAIVAFNESVSSIFISGV